MFVIVLFITAVITKLLKSEDHLISNDDHLDNAQPLYECNVKDHPYFISLHLGTISNVHCAGSLVGPSTVLTVAHCCVLYQTDPIIAVSGYGYQHGRYSQRTFVKGTHIHPNYKPWEPEKGNDLCLIHLNESMAEDSYTKLVELAYPGFMEDFDKTERTVRVMGYKWDPEDKPLDAAYTTQSHMHCSSLPIAKWHECKRKFPAATVSTNFCLKNEKATRICHVDEGGPVMYKGLQVGIVSFTPNLLPTCTKRKYLLVVRIKEETIDFIGHLDRNYTLRSEKDKSTVNLGNCCVLDILVIISTFFIVVS